MEQSYHSPFVSEANRALGRTFFTPLYELIERGKQEKKLKNVDTKLHIFFYLAA